MPGPSASRKTHPRTHFRGVVLTVALLVAAGPLAVRALSASSDWLAHQWLTDQGLPHPAVRAVHQTRDGYLWVGTDHGLARFDGVRFVTFRATETRGLNGNRIQCLHEDAQGALWIGTDGGGLARHQDGTFTTFTTRDGLSSDTILCLGPGATEGVWAGTASGLNFWNEGRVTTYFRIDGLPDDRVEALGRLRGADVVLGTSRGAGLLRDGKFGPLVAGPDPGPRDVRRLLGDARGRVWLGAKSGPWWVQDGQVRAVPWPEGMPPTTAPVLIERAGGEIWCGTSGGIVSLDHDDARPPSASWVWRSDRPVLALCEDREGNVWVGTAGNGLFRLARRQVQWLPLPEAWGPVEVATVAEGAEGAPWMAAGAGGVLRWQDGGFTRFQHPRLPEGAVARDVCLAADGGVWIGTQGDGLYRWQAGQLTRYGHRDGLSDNSIEALVADPKGGVWISTRNGGLNHWLAGRVRRFDTPWGYSGNFANVLVLDREGSLWIGTTGDGLFRLREDRFERFTETHDLPDAYIHALAADDDGSVWIGTAGGLGRFRAGRLKSFTPRHGLPKEAIAQVQVGPSNDLWIGTARGLFRLDRRQLQNCAEGRIRSVEAVPYGRTDGLTELQCVPGARSDSGTSPAHRLWFPTPRGLAWIEARHFVTNPLPPPVVIEQALVGNENVPLADGVRVAPGREDFQLHFTALSLAAPEKARFRYLLEGFDREWNDVGASRLARYTHVPPGRYRFRVRASNNDGLWNTAGAAVAVTVLPFWWQTAWFKWGILAAVTAGGVGLHHLRRSRRREIERLRGRIAGDLHDEVGSSLWSITLLSRILQEHGSLGEEAKRDVSEIHRIAVQTSNSVRDIVWIINPAYDTVQDLVLRMKDFAGTALRGVDLRLAADRADLSRKLSLEFRQNVFLLYKEAVSNIAKHAQARRIEIDLEDRSGEWRLSIRDDGIGFDPGLPASGHGLGSLRARAARLGGRLELHSRPGAGTTVLFAVPLPSTRPRRVP